MVNIMKTCHLNVVSDGTVAQARPLSRWGL